MGATMIRNNMPGPTVFSDEESKQHVEWQGAGNPDGLDVQPVPPVMIDNVRFQQAITRGILQVEEADAIVQQTLESHRKEWESRQVRVKNAGRDEIDRKPDNDTLVLDCLGPAGKSGGKCPNPVAVKSNKRGDAPPLCMTHTYLKKEFVPEETERVIGGKPEVVWKRIPMVNRERG